MYVSISHHISDKINTNNNGYQTNGAYEKSFLTLTSFVSFLSPNHYKDKKHRQAITFTCSRHGSSHTFSFALSLPIFFFFWSFCFSASLTTRYSIPCPVTVTVCGYDMIFCNAWNQISALCFVSPQEENLKG